MPRWLFAVSLTAWRSHPRTNATPALRVRWTGCNRQIRFPHFPFLFLPLFLTLLRFFLYLRPSHLSSSFFQTQSSNRFSLIAYHFSALSTPNPPPLGFSQLILCWCY
ncbi:hypothetical protein RIF29_22933 [Crotalaria pallida]|uniref:Uncharacterized protein n=1 Tax=Crotalaria pallida TaxID=3830 RepID=A0AAN9I9N4_CROPI